MGFEHRGIVEGYYGPPYRHEERLRWLTRLGRWGMNRYVYAPKGDPLHREAWRTPYPADELARFEALVRCGEDHGVDFAMGISPGIDIEYASTEDQARLAAKLAPLRERGVRQFVLALDDVPARLTRPADLRSFASLADAHVAVAHALLASLGEGVGLWFVPTDYLGVAPTNYLAALGEQLDPAIEIGWTGRTVLSPEIRSREAAERAATLRRRPLVWDNYPVADGPMRTMLHLGPYTGRDADLGRHLSGVLLNPMQWPRSSAVAVRTAAAYLADPEHFEPEAEWQAALAEVGSGAPEAFARLAEAHRFSSLCDERDRELEAAFEELQRDPAGPALAAIKACVGERLAVAETLRAKLADRALLDEIEPWVEAHHEESARIDAALDLLAVLASRASRLDMALAYMRFASRIQKPLPAVNSYGPRRVLYPQLISMREDEAAFGPDPSLRKGLSLSEDITQFAEQTALTQLTTN